MCTIATDEDRADERALTFDDIESNDYVSSKISHLHDMWHKFDCSEKCTKLYLDIRLYKVPKVSFVMPNLSSHRGWAIWLLNDKSLYELTN